MLLERHLGTDGTLLYHVSSNGFNPASRVGATHHLYSVKSILLSPYAHVIRTFTLTPHFTRASFPRKQESSLNLFSGTRQQGVGLIPPFLLLAPLFTF